MTTTSDRTNRTHRVVRRAPRTTVVWTAGLAGLLLVGGCDQLPWFSKSKDSGRGSSLSDSSLKALVLPDQIVAKINGTPVTKADVELRVEELKAVVTRLGQTWETLPVTAPQGALSIRAIADELVNNELLSQDALARGLDRETQTQRRWDFIRRGFLAQEWVRWHQEQLEVSSDDITQYYNQFQVGFQEPDRLRLRQLTVDGEEQAKRALVQLHEGTDFAALAQQLSTGPHAQNGGLIPEWIMRGNEKAAFAPEDREVISLGPGLESAAFAIDGPDRVSNYVRGPDGRFHIFQLVERQEGRQQPIAEVWDDIKAFLTVQRLNERMEALRSQAVIEFFPDALGGVIQ